MLHDLIRAAFPESGDSPSVWTWGPRLLVRFLFQPAKTMALLRRIRREKRAGDDLYPLW